MSGHTGTIVSVAGTDNLNLRMLFNLYYEPLDSDEILSMVAEGRHNPDVHWESIHQHPGWLTHLVQTGAGSLFAVSMDGELHTDRRGEWEVLDLGCEGGLNAVFAAGEDAVACVGNDGARVTLRGDAVRVDHDPRGRRLSAVHGTSARNVIAVGDGGLVCRFDGTGWEDAEVPTDANLLCVLCRSETEAYAAGTQGALLAFDGERWRPVADPIDAGITGLAWFADRLYAVAGRGGVFRLEGARLEPIKELTLYHAQVIGDRLFAWGDKLLAQFDGQGWWGGPLDLGA